MRHRAAVLKGVIIGKTITKYNSDESHIKKSLDLLLEDVSGQILNVLEEVRQLSTGWRSLKNEWTTRNRIPGLTT